MLRRLNLLNKRHSSTTVKNIRNLAIIAHVDHGKTSLVDQLLKQSGVLKIEQNQRIMDSNEIEKERGITIFSKNASLDYKGMRINLVDTPGHADFGGEVERILSMVDGVCLLVDATEGPMTQTRFVLSKALALKLKPIVVMNKVDRDTANTDKVDNDLLELFINLNATDAQMEYPIIYASAKEGWATTNLSSPRTSILPLLDTILAYIPPPKVDRQKPFSMLVTQLETNKFLGKCSVGKVYSGSIKVGDQIHTLDSNSKSVQKGKCTKIFVRRGVDLVSVEEAGAGDIISIAGLEGAYVNHTICSTTVNESLDHVPIDSPTIAMQFFVNDSPLQGEDGKFLTSQMIRDRLSKEIETNVALQVKFNEDSFEVKGRGELQMGVLIEQMRREGFELSVSPPRVIYRDGGLDADRKRIILEPIEEVTISVEQSLAGGVIEALTKRKAEMETYDGDEGGGMSKLVFRIPTRGLLGYPAEFKNSTHGEGTLNHILLGYEPFKGLIEKERAGSLISTASGVTTAFALNNIEARGRLFIGPGQKVYPGLIIGETSRGGDLEVNPVKAKQLTNVRAAGKEDTIKLISPKENSLEELISYIQDDEIIEITPKSIRTRKKILNSDKRKAVTRRNPLDLITFD